MRNFNREEYRDIPVSSLGFSKRTLNCLTRAGIDNLYLMIENRFRLGSLCNMGDKSLDEVMDFTAELKKRKEPMEIVKSRCSLHDVLDDYDASELPEQVLDRPVTDMNLPCRIVGCLLGSKISTVRQLVEVSSRDIQKMRNMGSKSAKQLIGEMVLLFEQGEKYFDFRTDSPAPCSIPYMPEWYIPMPEISAPAKAADSGPEGKGFDFPLIDELTERFSFRPIHMAEWFGLSRQGIYNALEKRAKKRYRSWTGNELTEPERDIIASMVENVTFDYRGEGVICECLNDRSGDLACIFVYENEIRCFFLKDLPEDLRQRVTDANYHRFTVQELTGGLEGETVYILTKPYFLPRNPDRFRACANARGMKADELSVFATGYPVTDTRNTDDRKIRAYLEERMTDGKVYISSSPEHQWLRSIASRNGYSMSGLIRLYGYESVFDGDELTAEGARKRHIEELRQCIVHDNVVFVTPGSRLFTTLNSYVSNKGIKMNDYIRELGFERTTERPVSAYDALEEDMQVREKCEDFAENIFAQYPLLGGRIISQSTMNTLNSNARQYLDMMIRKPNAQVPFQRKMEIVIALINNAKGWTSEEDSRFWNYICLQFGHRWDEENDPVERLLKNILEEVMKKKRRLFIEDRKGRGFKSTIVVHAMSTKRSWMYLFDFLFDFYKENLDWKVIDGDPLTEVMVRALQSKLKADGDDDAEISISSKLYYFQEGIRKLVLSRPGYTRTLFEKLLRKIDDLVNSREGTAETYEEQLCEEWFRAKVTAIAGRRRAEYHGQGAQRDIVIDYTKIRAKLALRNENEVMIVLPEIRLGKESEGTPILSICSGGRLLAEKPMTWYGNELGRTLHAVSERLPGCTENGGEMNLSVRIECGGEVLYDSEDTLCRRVMFFSGSSEVSESQLKKGGYTLAVPEKSVLKTENISMDEIDDFRVPGFRAYYMQLEDGYLLNVDGRLAACDSAGDTDIRVVVPAESSVLPGVTCPDGERCFAYRGSSCDIIIRNCELLQQFYIRKNGEHIVFGELERTDSGDTASFTCPVDGDGDICRIQVLDINDEQLVFDRSFILIESAEGHFSREFYFSEEDYRDAAYTVTIDGVTMQAGFGEFDSEAQIPYHDGVLHAAVPKITVEETTGEWLNGDEPAWHIGKIPQNSMLKVSCPARTDVRFLAGGRDIMYDGSGTATIGNVLHSFSDSDIESPARIVMSVRGKTQRQDYTLTQVYFREGFLKPVEFWSEENRLYWNHGGGFIGLPDRRFTLSLNTGAEEPAVFELDDGTDSIEIPDDMSPGNYRYEISVLSGGLFGRKKTVIAGGSCIIGDVNVLRFMGHRIVIDSVTDSGKYASGSIKVKKCYIDGIEFRGMEDTSEGYCPVYSGRLYTDGFNGERYEFSSGSYTNDRGIEKLPVNPVRLVYIGDDIMCITDSDGDGIYYSYHYNDSGCIEYVLTDREPTKANEKRYSVADLYIYRTERTS